MALPGGGLAAAGSSSSGGKGLQDAWLLIVDAAGNQKASVLLGGAENDGWHYSVVLGADGKLATAGSHGTFGYVAKFSQAGEPLWQRTYGGTAPSRFDGIDSLPDGGCLVAGS